MDNTLKMMRRGSPTSGAMGAITDEEMAGMDNQYLRALIRAAMAGGTGGAMGSMTEGEMGQLRGMQPPMQPPQQPPQQPPMQSPDDAMYMGPRSGPQPSLEQYYRMMMQKHGINGRPVPGPTGPRRPMPGIMGGVRG